MNILVLGNGFDLAHKLPTHYEDFLKFATTVKENINQLIKNGTYKNYDKTYHVVFDKCSTLKEVIEQKELIDKYKILQQACKVYRKQMGEIIKGYNSSMGEKIENEILKEQEYNPVLVYFLQNNLWYNYFEEKIKSNMMKGKNWIDFESEISNVVKKLERVRGISQDDNKTNDFIEEKLLMMADNRWHDNKAIEKLADDLEIFVRVLELYLSMVEKTPNIKPLEVFEHIDVDYILSFNYTDWFDRIYNTKSKLNELFGMNKEFIHGKCGEKNLILGTEETLPNDEQNKDISCIRFKKYFQRIYYKTGLKYKDWLDSTGEEQNNIYIFGHSLDVTDKDVLSELILHKKTNTVKIYYHDEKAHAKQIANLVKIIGKDELISRASNKKIEFINQNDN